MATYNPQLRERLLRLAGKDIAAIEFANSFSKRSPAFRSKEFVQHVEQADAQELKAILATEGQWPGTSRVGSDGAIAAFIVAQHADADVELQKQALQLMAESVANGDMPAGAMAFLTDRVLINEGKPQLFGTQFKTGASGQLEAKPLFEPENLDARRAGFGLREPHAAYMQRMNAGDKVPFRELLEPYGKQASALGR